MSKEILDGLKALAAEREIPYEVLTQALEDALLSAYKKTEGAAKYARVELDEEGKFRVFALEVPSELEEELILRIEGETAVDPDTGRERAVVREEVDWARLEEYRDRISEREVTPKNFGRIAANAARQVIQQRIRQATNQQLYEEFAGREGELVVGSIQQTDTRHTLLRIRDGVEALLPRHGRLPDERYRQNQRVKAVIVEVSHNERGTSIIVSRTTPGFIAALLEDEVPEIQEGLVEVARVARVPGSRSKVGVRSRAAGVDPVGACIGPRGSRIRSLVSELGGERLDLVALDQAPERVLARALQPAVVREVSLDEENKHAVVVVPEDQVPAAVGQKGQNVRLASELTGWEIEIVTPEQFAGHIASQDEDDADDGRCHAVLRSGRRCPNMAEPGSRYCSLPAHQQLPSATESA